MLSSKKGYELVQLMPIEKYWLKLMAFWEF